MDAVERVDGISLNGSEMPKRIWLITYRHAGDVCWTSDPNPDDADEIETVEYVRADILSLARSNGWQDIATAPVDESVVFGYFGPDKQWHGFVAVVKQFQRECMDKPLPTGWPATVEPTHWQPLPEPPLDRLTVSETDYCGIVVVPEDESDV